MTTASEAASPARACGWVSGLAWLVLVTSVQAQTVPCPSVDHRVDAGLARLVDPIVVAAVADGFAGGVALMRDGALIFDRVAGFSDRRGKVAVTAATLFHVASITKYVTALLTLAAVDEGRLELAAPVGRLAPGTRLAERGVTFLDLLAHRSGLGSSYAAERKSDPAAAFEAIDSQPIDAAKVGRFRYSNDGYDLLAVLLERAYNRSYEELVREKVFSRACLDGPRLWADVDLTDPGHER